MIQSVARSLELLERLDAAGARGAALGDVVAATGLKAPTAHNLLQTLVELGYATHDAESRRYALGRKARSLGRRRFLDDELVAVAQPVLRELHDAFNESFLVALFRDGCRYSVAGVESGHGLRVGLQTGVDRNLYGSATGRMLLSRADAESVARFIQENGLPEDSWPEATSKEALWGELERIRGARFAVCERVGTHVRAVAVPVELPEPDTNVALGMYYPTVRPPSGGVRHLRRHLTEAASVIADHYERRET